MKGNKIMGRTAEVASGRSGSVGVTIMTLKYLVVACPLTLTALATSKSSPGSYLITWFQIHGEVKGGPQCPRPTLIVGTEPVDPTWLAKEMGFLHGTAKDMAEAITEMLKELREGSLT